MNDEFANGIGTKMANEVLGDLGLPLIGENKRELTDNEMNQLAFVIYLLELMVSAMHSLDSDDVDKVMTVILNRFKESQARTRHIARKIREAGNN